MSGKSKSSSLPTYDFLKRLHSPVNLEYSRLEVAYNNYDSSHAHRHDYFEVILFEKSGGFHEIDFISYPVKANTIHFITPGQVHLLRRNKNVTGHIIAFKEEAILPSVAHANELLILSSAIIPVIKLKGQDLSTAERKLSNLIAEYAKADTYSGYGLSACLVLLLIDLLRMCERDNSISENSSGNNLYRNFRRLVDRNITSIHSVNDYAKMLHISPGHLNDVVKDVSGKSASEIIYDRLILEAKRLLYHSALSIKEISQKLSYEDPAYFTRFFRKHVNQTPVQFREGVRSQDHK